MRGSDGPYEGDPFDYLAAYIFQEDVWYIIPAELVVGQGSIALYPKLKGAKYGPYKEAWHLLKPAVLALKCEARDLQAVADRIWWWSWVRGWLGV